MDVLRLTETVAKMSSNQDVDRRQEVLFEANCPALSEAIKHGMKVKLIPSEDYVKETAEKLAGGQKDSLSSENSQKAVACQIGVDRSTELKLFGIDADVPFALTEKDKEKLKYRNAANPYPKIGMSLENLGELMVNGEVKNGQIYPKDFPKDKPITGIVGLVDSKFGDIELNDVELMAKYINVVRQRKGLDKLDLELTIVHGVGQVLKNGLDEVRKSQNIKLAKETR